jgi:hypothetical protein
MAEYSINKGIGRPAEFRGLKSQYLYIFVGGIIAIFIVFVVMYIAGAGQWACIAFGLAAGLTLTYFTFRLNARYGAHGMMKYFAHRSHPRRIRSDKSVLRIIKTQTQW